MSPIMLTEQQIKTLLKECQFHTSRSGGKGGQNVNKVETKVEIDLDIEACLTLNPEQKRTILNRHKALIDGKVIKVVGTRYRSQLENKEDAKKKLILLLQKLLKPVKKRIATKPGKKAKENKLQAKKHRSDKKQFRKKISDY